MNHNLIDGFCSILYLGDIGDTPKAQHQRQRLPSVLDVEPSL